MEKYVSDKTWYSLNAIKKKIRKEPEKEKWFSEVMIGLEEYTRSLNLNDGLGMTSSYLEICIKNQLPWVATLTACKAFNNAFINVSKGIYDVNDFMVWSTIGQFQKLLDQREYYHQLGFLSSYGAKFWCKSDDCKIDNFLFAVEKFKIAEQWERVAQDQILAAELIEPDDPLEAANLYLNSAEIVGKKINIKSQLKFSIISILRRARICANRALEYELAAKARITEKKFQRHIYIKKIKSESWYIGLIALKSLITSWVDNLLTGHFEKPFRVLLCSVFLIFIFAALYLPEFNLVKLEGFPKPGNLLDSILVSLHFSTVTFTTLGFGNINPGVDRLGIILTSIEAFLGMVLIGLFLFCVGRKTGQR